MINLTQLAFSWFRVLPTFLALVAPASFCAEADFSAAEFETTDGAQIHASLFEGKKDLAVILAHGAVFNKESWYPLARRLEKEGLTCLSIDFRGYGKSTAELKNAQYNDVTGAVAFLKTKEYKSVALVGASMGAMAVLEALSHAPDNLVSKAVVLAAPGGQPIESTKIIKLFVVSEGDPVAASLKAVYERSAEPKQIKILSGSAHAQHIFKTANGPALTELIAEFLR